MRKVMINGHEYTYCNKVRDNDNVRLSLNRLLGKAFGINLEQWYQSGYWQDAYIPNVLLDGDRAVSNLSVNIISTVWQDNKKLYIQFGGVTTDSKYRNRGLSRWLMNQVLSEWEEKCDAVYLYANDSVIDFYPKFGFVKADEYQYRMPAPSKFGRARKLDMDSANDIELLFRLYKKSNPFSVLPMLGNTGLLMFYCSDDMKDNVYYDEKLDAVIIAEFDGDMLNCHDIFCDEGVELSAVLAAILKDDTKTIAMGFAPSNIKEGEMSILEDEDTTFFVLERKENIFVENRIRFPLLSRG